MNEEILALLETKFRGVRKDGLTQMANFLAVTCASKEEYTAAVEKLTDAGVEKFVKDWRKTVDAENTLAAQKREANIREKYDLKEKGVAEPGKDEPKNEPNKNMTSEDIQKLITEAVTRATEKLQSSVSSMQAGRLAEDRRKILEETFAKDVPENFKKNAILGFEGRQFENDEAFNSYLETVKTNTSEFMQEMANRGLTGQQKPILGTPNKDGVSAGVSDYIKEKTDDKTTAGLGGIKI